MRKITLLSLMLFSCFAFSQVGISENFDSGTPAGWTDSYSNTATAACAGNSERDNIWSSSTTGNLTSPNQVGASNGTDLAISFDYKIVEYNFSNPTVPQGTGWGTAEVQYSTDDGANWTTVLTIDDGNHVTSADCATMMATVPAASIPNGSDVKLQIANTWAAGDYYFYVDNFSASQVTSVPPNCDSVLSATTDIGLGDDNISWSSATGAPTGYKIVVGTSTGTDNILALTDVGNVTTYTVSGLSYSTTYYITITSYNANGDATGCTEQTFTTQAPPPVGSVCVSPIALTVEADCSTATPTTLDYSAAFDLGTTDLSCDTFGVNTGSWYEFVAPATGSIFVNLSGDTAEYAVFDGCGTQVVCVSTATNQGEVTGLTAGNTYQLAVWKDSATSGTTDICLEAITCPNPSTLAVANITTTTADLSWAENGSATAWNIEIVDITAGGTATGTATSTGVMNPHTATGLTPANDYEFYVQSDCGGDTSDWIGPFAFTTECVALTPYYNADMSANVPACWNEADNGDAASGPMDIGSSAWIASNHNGTPSNRFNLYLANRSDWIISPEFDLSGSAPSELKVYVALTENGTSGSGADLGSDDRVSLLMTTDGGASWSALQAWVQGNVPTDVGEEITYDLTAQTGTVQFAFLAQEGAVDDTEDIYFHVSKFEVREIPACAEPTAAMAANITLTTADLSWTEAGSATSWNIEMVDITAGGTPTGTPTTTGVTNPYTATGLTPNNNYEYYVQADCGGSTSIWVGPIAFRTGHCVPAGTSTSTYIDTFATTGGTVDITNAGSGISTDNYGDFYDTATVTRGQDQDINFNVEIVSGTVGCAIWVDWNNDLVFDSSEVEYSTTSYGSGPFTGTFTTPAAAADGEYRMRVMIDWNDPNPGDDDACSFGSGRGEVEDYKLVIDSTLGVESAEIRGFTHYVDTVNNNFVVNAQSEISSIEVYNLVGQVIATARPNSTTGIADLGAVKNGVYFAKVTLNNRKTSVVKFAK